MFYGQRADLRLNCCNICTEWLCVRALSAGAAFHSAESMCLAAIEVFQQREDGMGCQWLLRSSQTCSVFVSLPKLIWLKCNAYTIWGAHWPNNPKCNRLHVLPRVSAANKSGFIFRRECTASVYTHAALDKSRTQSPHDGAHALR